MKHDAAVALLPGFNVREGFAGQAVFEAEPIARKRHPIREMAETLPEAVAILVVGDPDDAVLRAEGAERILAKLMTADLRGPAGQRLAVE